MRRRDLNRFVPFSVSCSFSLLFTASVFSSWSYADSFDSDMDGMPDYWESAYGLNIYSADDALTSLDMDTLSNLAEFQLRTNPRKEDTDFDGVPDGLDLWPLDPNKNWDHDGDGIPASWEVSRGLNDDDAQDATQDNDFDGLINLQEYQAGTRIDLSDSDFDGIKDGEDIAPLNAAYRFDHDGDGLPELWEQEHHFNDGDAGDAAEDTDSDGLTNLQEYQAGTDPRAPDSDHDGVADGQDLLPTDARYSRDEDGDGMADEWEQEHGLRSDDPTDAIFDEDYDGLSNLQEYQLGTNPQERDSDGDWVEDGEDRFPTNPQYRHDFDRDGLPTFWENQYGLDVSRPEDRGEDPDGDGLTNALEFELGTNPINPDTDGDSARDSEDWWPLDPNKNWDHDGDGIPASWEVSRGLNDDDAQDATQDNDFDGLTNLQEYQAGTRIDLSDSDFDGIKDGEDIAPLNAAYRFDHDGDGLPELWEQEHHFNDGDAGDAAEDTDSDGLTNLQEYQAGTDPRDPDSDHDGVADGQDLLPTDARYSRDEDGDGMADEWEQEHGLRSDDPTDAIFDEDYDGLSNLQEYQLGTNPQERDSDGDWVEDGEDRFPTNPQYRHDFDGDGLPTFWENQYGLDVSRPEDRGEDPDGDGLTNALEFELGTNPINPDTDGDSARDSEDWWPLDPNKNWDHDGDGIPASWEVSRGLNDDDAQDATQDNDFDGLTNLQEYQAGTRIDLSDSDFDGIKDGEDIAPLNAAYRFDHDGDGLPELWEQEHHFNDGDAGDAAEDTDSDGLTNLQEYQAGTDPRDPDSDHDGVADGQDLLPTDARYSRDEDGDGMADEWEQEHGLRSDDPTDAIFDEDYDGLSNLQEYQLGTNPQERDSDGDWVEDGEDRFPTNSQYRHDFDGDGLPTFWENQYGLDASRPEDRGEDPDGDGLTNALEFELGTNPINPDTDGDNIPDNTDPSPAE
ncbi:hypothetical protein ACJJJB_15315 [Microbulbifer sp. ANSA001]|uniref:hypothetical protein n=1 Tax=Microbulbifer sp. ANSA001 TaxID=3243358 RepID=UPI0040428F2B